MDSVRTLIGSTLVVVPVFLAIVPAFTSAQSPYVINGLQSELRLDAAVARAKKLGGNCQVVAGRSNDQGRDIQCEYRHCNETATDAAPADKCDAEEPIATGPTFARQPIVSIVLQAPADRARVTRIVMVYSGDTDAVAAGLIEVFGPAEADGTPSDNTSWSHARRWSWRAGPYRMGLLNSPQWITLATDRPPAASTGDMSLDTPP